MGHGPAHPKLWQLSLPAGFPETHKNGVKFPRDRAVVVGQARGKDLAGVPGDPQREEKPLKQVPVLWDRYEVGLSLCSVCYRTLLLS